MLMFARPGSRVKNVGVEGWGARDPCRGAYECCCVSGADLARAGRAGRRLLQNPARTAETVKLKRQGREQMDAVVCRIFAVNWAGPPPAPCAGPITLFGPIPCARWRCPDGGAVVATSLREKLIRIRAKS